MLELELDKDNETRGLSLCLAVAGLVAGEEDT